VITFRVNSSSKLEFLPTETVISVLNLRLDTHWRMCRSAFSLTEEKTMFSVHPQVHFPPNALRTYEHIDTLRFLKLNCIYRKSRRTSRTKTFLFFKHTRVAVFNLKTFRLLLSSLSFLVFLLRSRLKSEKRLKSETYVLWIFPYRV